MGLTAAQVEERKHHIGASDVATIMGYNPYQTGRELFLEKTNRLEPELGDQTTSLGTRLEPVILDVAEEELGPLERDVVVECQGLDFPLKARCDALFGQIPVEAKTMGLFNAFFTGLDDWGEEFTDEIPDQYSVQVTTQMMCTGADQAHVFAFLSGRGICSFTVGRSSVVVEGIKTACGKFWECIESDTEPESDDFLSLDVAKRFRRLPDKIVTLTEDCYQMINACDEWKESAKEAKKNIDGLNAEIIASLGGAEAGILPDGRLVTYPETHRKAYSVQATSYRSIKIKGKASK